MDEKRYVVCSCGALNRVPAERKTGTAKCGRCSEALELSHSVFNLSSKNLAEVVANSPVPVVVDFWAPWCGPCVGFAPVFEAYAASHSASAVFVKLNTEAEPEGGARHNIRSIPTLLVFSEGQEKARQSGAMPAPMLTNWLKTQGVS